MVNTTPFESTNVVAILNIFVAHPPPLPRARSRHRLGGRGREAKISMVCRIPSFRSRPPPPPLQSKPAAAAGGALHCPSPLRKGTLTNKQNKAIPFAYKCSLWMIADQFTIPFASRALVRHQEGKHRVMVRYNK